jgi:hypothetical protein
MFVGSKAPWFEITDGLPTFETYPLGHDVPMWPTPQSKDAPGEGVRGSCLCGEVCFVITGEPLVARYCHCLRCRRARGALHASNMVVPLDALRFTHGEEAVRSFKLPQARYFTQAFCRLCGSAMPHRDTGRQIAIVPLGSLDDDPGVRPREHIWVDSKATWHEITDALPQYSQAPVS